MYGKTRWATQHVCTLYHKVKELKGTTQSQCDRQELPYCPLTSKLAETLSCLKRDFVASPSRLKTSQEFPFPWPKGLIDFWLVVLCRPRNSMTSSFEWQLIRLHSSMGICLDTGNLELILVIRNILENKYTLSLIIGIHLLWPLTLWLTM